MHTEVDTFSHICSWFARPGDGSFVRIVTSAFLLFSRETGPYHVLLHRKGKRAEVFVVARLVNLQECRIKRDPLFTDRSSTKPCGRSQNGTRTSHPSAPVPMDLYGMGFYFFIFLHNSFHCPQRPVRVIKRRIRSRSVKSTRERKHKFICAFTELLFFRVEDPSGLLAFRVWVGIRFVFVHFVLQSSF